MPAAPGSLEPGLPTIGELDRIPAPACAAALAPLFEGAPAFLARLCAARPFGDAPTLFARARAVARAMPEAAQLELIDGHPRLGAPPPSLSRLSFAEQGHDRAAGEVAEAERAAALASELARLNDAYEARFGFRYCVFVAGRPREALLPRFEEALVAARGDEIARALDAVVDIAADRWHALTTRRYEQGMAPEDGRP